jgi:hypothetical protein
VLHLSGPLQSALTLSHDALTWTTPLVWHVSSNCLRADRAVPNADIRSGMKPLPSLGAFSYGSTKKNRV